MLLHLGDDRRLVTALDDLNQSAVQLCIPLRVVPHGLVDREGDLAWDPTNGQILRNVGLSACSQMA